MLLSIIIPVYNEKNTLHELLNRVEKVELPAQLNKEIIIVDDCSTDGTRDILKELNHQYKIIYHYKNQGKGAALKNGYLACQGDIIINQDADLEYNPQDYPLLLAPILEGEADVVYGSRLLSGQVRSVLYYWHYVANRLITTLSNMLTNLNLTDMETCYKVFTRQVIDKIKHDLKSKRFDIEPEITARVARHKFRVYEVGISYHGRTYAEGKKLNWQDAFIAVWSIIKFNLFK